MTLIFSPGTHTPMMERRFLLKVPKSKDTNTLLSPTIDVRPVCSQRGVICPRPQGIFGQILRPDTEGDLLESICMCLNFGRLPPVESRPGPRMGAMTSNMHQGQAGGTNDRAGREGTTENYRVPAPPNLGGPSNCFQEKPHIVFHFKQSP